MDPALIAIVVAVIAPLGTYLIAARRFSGKINTTEAQELWKESGKIREWSQQRIDAQDIKIAKLETRIDGLFREKAVLTQEVITLRQTIGEQERTIKDCGIQLEKAAARVAQLEGTVNGER